ncbi:MAG: PEGA domain-containing protein [Polyangiaceae bacterium]|nr:PEGA domain-containing protein [Polyangiaceae bacterium]
MLRRALLALASGCLLAVALTTGAARADGGSMDAAKRAMEEGQTLYAEKKYAEAAAAFARAYSLSPYAAFLFNEGVAHERLGDLDRAVATFQRYLSADPGAPDAEGVRARVRKLEAAIAAKKEQKDPPPAPPAAPKDDEMRALVLVESEPAGAPADVWERVDPGAAGFRAEGDNAGWRKVTSGATPLAVTLPPGKYHVVLEKWRTFNRSESDVDVAAGRVHQFKANLSQGKFMAFLRVTSSVKGATIYLDDRDAEPWGTAPRGELIKPGSHKVWVEAPGFEPFEEEFKLDAGQRHEVDAALERVSYGYLLLDGNAPRFEVTIDGRPVGVFEGQKPLRIKEKAGVHRVVARADGKKIFDDQIEVPLGQSREVHVVFVNKYGRGAAWAAAVGSVAFLGGGIYLGRRSNQIHDDMKADRAAGRLTSDDDRASKGKAFALGADGAFAVGGALALLATWEFLRDPLPPSGAQIDEPRDFGDKRRRAAAATRPSVAFAPLVLGGQTGLAVGGRF